MPTFEEAVAKARDRLLQKEQAEIEYIEGLKDEVKMTKRFGRTAIPYKKITDIFGQESEDALEATEKPSDLLPLQEGRRENGLDFRDHYLP